MIVTRGLGRKGNARTSLSSYGIGDIYGITPPTPVTPLVLAGKRKPYSFGREQDVFLARPLVWEDIQMTYEDDEDVLLMFSLMEQ